MENFNKSNLERYLLKVLRNEILIADESFFILQTIIENWDKISIDGYDRFFKSTYSVFFVRYSLSLTKLFDKQNKKYETISIPFVLSYIEKEFKTLSIQERPNLNKQFSKLGYNIHFINSLSDIEMNEIIISHFKKNLPSDLSSWNIDLTNTLEVIKFYRDKHFAHNEIVESTNLPKTSFEESQKLLLYAKQFVSLFSLAYLNMFHSFDGERYIITDDAIMTNNSFKRVLEKAGLINLKDD
jgi:hypothetical protein